MNVMGLMVLMAVWGAGPNLPLGDVLTQVGKSVERFWEEFPSVTCDETVLQQKLGTKGKILYSQKSVFDYLIFMNFDGTDPAVEESRVLKTKNGKSENLPLLVSNGFPTLLLVFHPFYQGSFEYSRLEDEVVEGRALMRVQFRHIQGSRSTSALRLRGRDYPLDLQGTAWIEPKSGEIVRIKAGLVAPMDDVGLKALETEVSYAPIQFGTSNPPEWLPSVATVDLETVKQHWRNTHQFTEYRQFSVKSESQIKK